MKAKSCKIRLKKGQTVKKVTIVMDIPKDLLKNIPGMMMSCLWDAYMEENVVFEEKDWVQFVVSSDMYFKGKSVPASSVQRIK